MKPKVYVAGPYTKGSVVANVRKAIEVGNQLAEMGYVPFIPHLNHFWNLLFSHEYEFWLNYDLEWVAICNAILRMPGESNGADREVVLADSKNIPIFFDVESLHRYFTQKG